MAIKGMLNKAKSTAREKKAEEGSVIAEPQPAAEALEPDASLIGNESEWFQWTSEQVYGAGSKSAQRYRLYLPVSKRHVECRAVLIDPRRTYASQVNPRSQELLSLADPNIDQLIRDMAGEPEEGITTRQREPVLVNRADADGRFEVVYGTRRRFAALHLCEQQVGQGGFPLVAWVPDEEIKSADKASLAISENEDREELSVWEKAQLINRLDDGNRTSEGIGAIVRLTERRVRDYRKIGEIPVDVVKRLSSPSAFTLEGGLALIKVAAKEGSYKKIVARLNASDATFEDMKSLVKVAAMPSVTSSKPALTSKKKVEIKDSAGKVAFKLGWVRGKEGQVKIDAFGCDEARVQALVDALESVIKP